MKLKLKLISFEKMAEDTSSRSFPRSSTCAPAPTPAPVVVDVDSSDESNGSAVIMASFLKSGKYKIDASFFQNKRINDPIFGPKNNQYLMAWLDEIGCNGAIKQYLQYLEGNFGDGTLDRNICDKIFPIYIETKVKREMMQDVKVDKIYAKISEIFLEFKHQSCDGCRGGWSTDPVPDISVWFQGYIMREFIIEKFKIIDHKPIGQTDVKTEVPPAEKDLLVKSQDVSFRRWYLPSERFTHLRKCKDMIKINPHARVVVGDIYDIYYKCTGGRNVPNPVTFYEDTNNGPSGNIRIMIEVIIEKKSKNVEWERCIKGDEYDFNMNEENILSIYPRQFPDKYVLDLNSMLCAYVRIVVASRP